MREIQFINKSLPIGFPPFTLKFYIDVGFLSFSR